jgi:7,8-dihydropterin-6-yl-methyl-4-(beta-D-ribofuranosyl)aminobenzene 5'-phosphate synthase
MRHGVGIGGVLVAVLLGACSSPGPGGATRATPVGSDRAATPAVTPAASAEARVVGSGHRVKALQITVLSTTLAPVGEGEWGFSALVEADGQRILFDTGLEPDTVLHNTKTLGIELDAIPSVVLTHHHYDHVGGLMTLRRAVAERAPTALATVHVGAGMFSPRRRGEQTRELNDMIAMRPAFEATGGTFVVHDGPGEIAPGVWVTGPVPRVHRERNWSGGRRIEGPDGWVEDTLPEGQELVVDTDEGLVVLSGCGHAGIVNIVTHARARIREAPLRAAVGGFHLMDATPAHLEWTGTQLRAVGVQELLGAHCTGRDAIQHFGAHVVAEGGRAVELGVGESFSLPGS